MEPTTLNGILSVPQNTHTLVCVTWRGMTINVLQQDRDHSLAKISMKMHPLTGANVII